MDHNSERIFIISPHYDDDVIGCGGSIALHSQKGYQVAVMYIMAGWSGVPKEPDKEKASQIRKQEAAEANKILGVSQAYHLDVPDRSFQPKKIMLNSFIENLRDWKPTIIYLPHKYEGDHEHKQVNEVAKEAIWLACSDYLPELGQPIPSAKLILGYEVWTPLDGYQLSRDITPVVELKERALKAHKSQLEISRWDKGSLGLNAYRGVTTGKGRYVEIFTILSMKAD